MLHPTLVHIVIPAENQTALHKQITAKLMHDGHLRQNYRIAKGRKLSTTLALLGYTSSINAGILTITGYTPKTEEIYALCLVLLAPANVGSFVFSYDDQRNLAYLDFKAGDGTVQQFGEHVATHYLAGLLALAGATPLPLPLR